VTGDGPPDPDDPADADDAAEPVVRLPADLRGAFKEPMGDVYAAAGELLAAVDGRPGDGPLIAVGDVVTYHLHGAGRPPDVALVDGLTERSAVRPAVRETIAAADARRLRARNPPGGLTRDLLSALRTALAAADPTVIEVDGEEDLAALPAIIAAPDGASVVYGQPGEGMVHVPVTAEVRARARALFERLDGDTAAATAALGAAADADADPDPDPDPDDGTGPDRGPDGPTPGGGRD